MGSHLSKKPDQESHSSSSNNLPLSRELNSYSASCRVDADLQAFDASLQARTSNVISSIAAGVEVRALSLDSLRQVTECLLDMNQQVVKVILDCKKDIWRNQDLFDLVEDYFDNSLKTLDFCAALDKCLKGARDSQLLILLALNQFEEERNDNDHVAGGIRYSKTLEELKNLRDAGDPFTDEFFQMFQSVYQQQMHMLDKLHNTKHKLDKKLKCISSWRRVSTMIFAATFAAVLICSVVAAAMAAPPVAAALAAATSIPLGSMGKWIDSLMKGYEKVFMGQKEMVNCMNVGTLVTIKDLDSIRLLIDMLEIEIESLVGAAEFAMRNEGTVRVGIEEIKKKVDVFMKSVEKLGAQADNCSRDIRKARTVILQRIIKSPSHSSD
ncbi:hypothetical protein SASPL_101133 [Salvia splendens]|uniref:Uncharacterized protein n=1 Tax=Salvia splendens TaxID=180675 RepID=A0A8X8YVA2_SALSN|nr:UPF0496 protein At4g34320-like [Salvia splendens]XP_041991279.1 UPF0496 protein At4g34320-like [Salvia splendens]KAG6436248.1 hypothetical protein SASPL_101133 [Salvia splendens]